MISIPIWLFVLFCIFGFIGLITFFVFIYGVVITLIKPEYISCEGDSDNN